MLSSMELTISRCKKELLKELEGLRPERVREVLDFARFMRTKEIIDPEQTYFWTKKWQAMEKQVEADKKHNRIVGNGAADDLLKKLGK